MLNNDMKCWNNYPNTTMITRATSCFETKPNKTSDCTSLSANGVACCYVSGVNQNSCFPIYSNQTKYILNNNILKSPSETISYDCGKYGTYSLPTNAPYYGDETDTTLNGNGTNTTLNGNGGMMLFNFLIFIFILLLVL